MDNPTWRGRNVLVTGAGGFIGSHLVEKLINIGASVKAMTHYNSRGDIGQLRYLNTHTLAKMEIIPGDLRNLHTVQNLVDGCDIVFHLGALISIPYSYMHPYEVAETNFMGTMNVFLACREKKVHRIIHTSTSEVYGSARYVPINESHPLQGQSPYSASKIGADKLAESFFCSYGLPIVTIRPFNTYGPRQSCRAVIPTIITQAIAGRTLKLGNIESIRDFTFVSDTVDGFLKAGESDSSRVCGGVYNLGTGNEIRIGDLAKKIIQKINPEISIKEDPSRFRPEKSEVDRLISDNSLAARMFGWHPRVDLDSGLDQTIQWIRDHINDYHVGVYEY